MIDGRPILLAEDDDVDAMCVERALAELKVDNPLVHVWNGEEALAYLDNPDNARPAIILLDINMPRMNGIEFLREIKQKPEHRRIPVVVFTTSENDRDRFEAFDIGISGYMVKPVDFNQFLETIKVVKQYWSISAQPGDA